MFTIITAFYLSLLGVVAMLLMKRHEVRSGHTTVVSRMGERSDRFFHVIFAALKRGASYFNKKSLIGMAQWIGYHVLLRVRHVYVEVKDKALANPHSKKVIDAVRGRAEVNPSGASFYLKRIADK